MKPNVSGTAIESQIERLLAEAKSTPSLELQNRLYHGTLTLIQALYGPSSSQEKSLRESLERIARTGHAAIISNISNCLALIRGSLEGMKADIAGGLLVSIRTAVTGEVLSDLLKLARTVLGTQGDGAKNVAGVLAAAAFEDTLRRMAEHNGIQAEGKLADVLSALKSGGIIQGAQVGIAQSYLGFRNKALHAKWDEIDRPEVVSILGFVEQLILNQFG